MTSTVTILGIIAEFPEAKAGDFVKLEIEHGVRRRYLNGVLLPDHAEREGATYWVIEKGGNPAFYWKITHREKGQTKYYRGCWVGDVQLATMFSHKENAEEEMQFMVNNSREYDLRVCPHMNIPSPAPRERLASHAERENWPEQKLLEPHEKAAYCKPIEYIPSPAGPDALAEELANRILQANEIPAYGGSRAELFKDVYPLQWFQAVQLAAALRARSGDKDGERYRWLREQAGAAHRDYSIREQPWRIDIEPVRYYGEVNGPSLNTAIDAAIRAELKGDEK